MTVTVASLRSAMPEFSDAAVYPDPQISFWLDLAPKVFDAGRWGELLDHGMSLFIAHNLVLQSRATKDAQFGKAPGQASGPVTSKSVDKVSISYDVSSAAEEGAGSYNLTVYGQQYIRLARIIGAGPVQIGALEPGSQSLYAGSVYAGPYVG